MTQCRSFILIGLSLFAISACHGTYTSESIGRDLTALDAPNAGVMPPPPGDGGGSSPTPPETIQCPTDGSYALYQPELSATTPLVSMPSHEAFYETHFGGTLIASQKIKDHLFFSQGSSLYVQSADGAIWQTTDLKSVIHDMALIENGATVQIVAATDSGLKSFSITLPLTATSPFSSISSTPDFFGPIHHVSIKAVETPPSSDVLPAGLSLSLNAVPAGNSIPSSTHSDVVFQSADGGRYSMALSAIDSGGCITRLALTDAVTFSPPDNAMAMVLDPLLKDELSVYVPPIAMVDGTEDQLLFRHNETFHVTGDTTTAVMTTADSTAIPFAKWIDSSAKLIAVEKDAAASTKTNFVYQTKTIDPALPITTTSISNFELPEWAHPTELIVGMNQTLAVPYILMTDSTAAIGAIVWVDNEKWIKVEQPLSSPAKSLRIVSPITPSVAADGTRIDSMFGLVLGQGVWEYTIRHKCASKSACSSTIKPVDLDSTLLDAVVFSSGRYWAIRQDGAIVERKKEHGDTAFSEISLASLAESDRVNVRLYAFNDTIMGVVTPSHIMIYQVSDTGATLLANLAQPGIISSLANRGKMWIHTADNGFSRYDFSSLWKK